MSSDRVWTEEFWRTATVVDLHSELRIFDLKTKDRNNSTLLHFAAEYTNSSLMITTLLAAGADIEAWDRMGRTPLYIAAGDESAAVAHGTEVRGCRITPLANPTYGIRRTAGLSGGRRNSVFDYVKGGFGHHLFGDQLSAKSIGTIRNDLIGQFLGEP